MICRIERSKIKYLNRFFADTTDEDFELVIGIIVIGNLHKVSQ